MRRPRGSQMLANDPQLRALIENVQETRTRVESAERRIQMLTDSFVVSGIWRNASSLDSWAKTLAGEETLQFEMTSD
jgi:hypothetical protein